MFDIKIAKSIDRNKIIFDDNGKYEFVGRSIVNNGVQGKINNLGYSPNSKGTFSLVQVGESVCLYRDKEWYASQNIFVLTPFDEQFSEFHQFISSVVNKALWQYKDAYIYPTIDEVKHLKIHLPIQNNKIDYHFMKTFIDELATKYSIQLETYLSVTGLKDFTLTKEEEKAIELYDSLNFEDFNILDIFTVNNTANILSSEIVENSGDTPYLCASSENNGVSSYIKYNEAYLEEGNCIFIGGKTFVVSYQEKDFYSNDSHNLALYLNNNELRTKLNQLYIAACLNKSLSHKYSWGNSISNAKIRNDRISLPSQNGKPDFSIMETFISAIQKLVIRDVVLYSENINKH